MTKESLKKASPAERVALLINAMKFDGMTAADLLDEIVAATDSEAIETILWEVIGKYNLEVFKDGSKISSL